MIRNAILLYVYHHQGCQLKDIANDLDINVSTIGTSLSYALNKHELKSTGRRPKSYYCDKPEVTEKDYSDYVFYAIKKRSQTTRSEIACVTGLSVHRINRELTRLKNLNKIETMTGLGVRVVKKTRASYTPRFTSKLQEMIYELDNRPR